MFDRQSNYSRSDQCRFGKPAGQVRYTQTITDMGMFRRNRDVGRCRSIGLYTKKTWLNINNSTGGEYSQARSNTNLLFVPFIFSRFIHMMNLWAGGKEIRQCLMVLKGEVLTDMLAIEQVIEVYMYVKVIYCLLNYYLSLFVPCTRGAMIR
jgi:hypothetical protein